MQLAPSLALWLAERLTVPGTILRYLPLSLPATPLPPHVRAL